MSSPGTTVIFCNACGAHNLPDARFCASCGQAMGNFDAVRATGSIAAYAEQPYGGFWIRVVAYIVDGIVLSVVLIPFTLILMAMTGVAGAAVRMPDTGVQAVILLTMVGLSIFAGWLYEALMTSSSKQATLGKMLVGVRVTDLEGKRISFGRATARYFAKYLSGMIFYIGFIMVGLTERKQGLHDMIAGTLVMKGKP